MVRAGGVLLNFTDVSESFHSERSFRLGCWTNQERD
jgi:hypothetical protein